MLQDCLSNSEVTGSMVDQGESEVADWFSQWWRWSIKGRWPLANGWYSLVAKLTLTTKGWSQAGCGSTTPSAAADR